MANYLLGDLAHSLISLLDAHAQPIIGASFTPVLNQDPSGSAIPYVITDKGTGEYDVTFTVNQPGTWQLVLESVTAIPTRWVVEHVVFAVGEAAPSVTETTGATQADLVQMIADLLGDLLTTTATQSGQPDGSTWVDELNLAAISPKSIKGSDLFITSAGPNQYREARVLDSSNQTPPTLTLTPNLPFQAQPGDTADITNLESKGWRRQVYHRVINHCIRWTWPNYVVPMTYPVPNAFSCSAPTFAVPGLTHIARIDWMDEQGFWSDIPRAVGNTPGGNGWAWDDAYQVVVIGGEQAGWADTRTLRIAGYGRAAILTSPSSVTSVDPEWIAYTASKLLLRNKGNPQNLALSSMDANDADLLRIKMLTNLPADCVQIR